MSMFRGLTSGYGFTNDPRGALEEDPFFVQEIGRQHQIDGSSKVGDIRTTKHANFDTLSHTVDPFNGAWSMP